MGEDGLDFESRYRELERLGQGGGGEVQLVFDAWVGREIAAKILHPNVGEDDSAYARFVLEARCQAQLEHPSIVPIHDIGRTSSGQPYFTMKRVRGQTLREILSLLAAKDPATEAKFSKRKLLAAFNSVCLAVAFAHERGYVHRDIKPSNIMLGDFGETYLLDWGIAKDIHATAASNAGSSEGSSMPGQTIGLIGTPGYMAPEQILPGRGPMGPASDLYALGAILFEILTLEPLHDPRHDVREILSATLAGVEARASIRCPHLEVPSDLEETCVRATRLDGSERLASARELSEAVERFLDGDQDLRMRRAAAAVALSEAETALHRAATPAHEREAELRSVALQAVARALAFDPRNERAFQHLTRLVHDPLDRIPRGAEALLHRTRAEVRTKSALTGAWVYTFFAAAVGGLLAWSGCESAAFHVISVLAPLMLGGISLFCARSDTHRDKGLFIHIVGANLMMLLIMRVTGPLVLTPTVLLAIMSLLAGKGGPKHRILSGILPLLTVALPVLLEVLGIVPASYVFTSEGVLIPSRAVPFTPMVFQLGILGFTLLLLGFNAFHVSRSTATLEDTETRVAVHTWLLSQLLPADAKPRSGF